jgi:Tol biopolymer transport system component
MSTRFILIILSALILTACGASPQAIQQAYDAHTRCTPVTYSSPVWSADGSQLYYTVGWSGTNSEVRSVTLDRFVEQVLIPDTYGVRFSPDVTAAVFRRASNPPGSSNHYFYDLKQNTTRRLLTSAGFLVWSPDSRWVAYTDTSVPGYLYKVDVITGETFQLTTEPAVISGLTWVPDGQGIVISSDLGGGYAIYLVEQDGSGLTVLLDGLEDLCATSPREVPNYLFQNWLPDSTTLSAKRVCSNDEGLKLVSTIGNGPDPAFWEPSSGISMLSVVWSPDGNKALIEWRDQSSLALSISDADGSNVRLLKDMARMGAWSGDSQQIAYISEDANGLPDVWVINADGTNPRRITNNPGRQHTCWH